MAVVPTINVDSVFYALGPAGRYQMLHLFMVSVSVLPCLFQLLDNVFIGAAVEHNCAPPDGNSSSYLSSGDYYVSHSVAEVNHSSLQRNTSLTFDECHIRVRDSAGDVLEEHECVYGNQYKGPISQSVVSQLGLVCDKNQLLRVTQTLVFAGQGFGAAVGPFFSDRYGRKPAMVVANIAMLALGMIIAFAPNFFTFAAGKFLIGAFQQALYVPVCIYTGELFPTEFRRYSIIFSTVSWSVSGCTMTLVAYFLKDFSWRYLQATLSMASLAFLLHICVLDESIVWLLANGMEKRAIKCIERAARWNGKDLETVLKAGRINTYSNGLIQNGNKQDVTTNSKDDLHVVTSSMLPEDNSMETDSEESSCKGDMDGKMSFLHILKIRRLLINALAMWCTWLSASLCYFTLYLMVSSLAGDRYLNYLLTSLMDIPACFIFYFGFNRYGRRSVTILLYSILAFGTFALGLLRHFTDDSNEVWSAVTMIMSLISIVGGSGCFFSIFFYLPELFPTNLRNQATGFASFFARIGAMVSPFMGALAGEAIWLPGVLMCVLACVAIFLLFLLPETKDKQLPQSVAEMEGWYKNKDQDSKGNINKTTKTDV